MLPSEERRWVRILTVLLPVLCVLGPYASFLPGSSGFPYFYRIACAVLVLFTVPLLWRTRMRENRVVQVFTGLALLWGLWTPLTLLWTPTFGAGVKEVLAAGLAVLGAWVMFALSRGREDGLDLLRRGWLWAAGILAVISVLEVATGYHTISLVGGHEWLFRMRTISATFSNPNGLSMFAAFAFLLVGAALMRGLSRRMQVAAVVALLLCVYVVLAAGGRAGQYSILAAGLALALVTVPTLYRTWIPWVLILLALATPLLGRTELGAWRPPNAVAVIAKNPDTYKNPENNLDDPELEETVKETKTAAANSRADQARVRYTKMGLSYVKSAPVQGHGAGSTVHLLEHDNDLGQLPAIPLHNSVLQIAVNYGLILALPLVLACLYLGFALLQGIRFRGDVLDLSERAEGLGALGITAVASIGLSSIFNEAVFMAILGYVAACAWVVSARRRRRLAGDVAAPTDAVVEPDARVATTSQGAQA